MGLHISARMDRERVEDGKDHEGFAMVSIKADEDAQRSPVCLSLVIDVSGSMNDRIQSGETKLEAVKATARKIIQNLSSADELSIIAFSSSARVACPRRAVTNKDEFAAIVNSLRDGGGTNLSAGLLAGMGQINVTSRALRRVLLLTDGEANEGIVEKDALVQVAKERRGNTDASLSTFAFGTRANRELLEAMSKEADGNSYYIEGGDVRNVFGRELGGLLSCVGQNILVKLIAPKGTEVVEVLNDFPVRKDQRTTFVEAADIYAGEVKHILFRLKVSCASDKPDKDGDRFSMIMDSAPAEREAKVGLVEVHCDGVGKIPHASSEIPLALRFVAPGKEDKEAVLEVAEQVAFIGAARAQRAAVEQADAGNYAVAQSALGEALDALNLSASRGSALCADAVDSHKGVMEALSPDTYSSALGSFVSNTAYNASRYRDVTGAMAPKGISGAKGLRSMTRSLGTKAKNLMADSFAAEDEPEEKSKALELNEDDEKKEQGTI